MRRVTSRYRSGGGGGGGGGLPTIKSGHRLGEKRESALSRVFTGLFNGGRPLATRPSMRVDPRTTSTGYKTPEGNRKTGRA